MFRNYIQDSRNVIPAKAGIQCLNFGEYIMKKTAFLFTMISLLVSCSSDKILNGTYYFKHSNSIEEYLIVKPDSTFIQFILQVNGEIISNKGKLSSRTLYSKSGLLLEDFYSVLDTAIIDLYTASTMSLLGEKQIIIDVDLYDITMINKSFNSDSVLAEINK